LFSDKQLQAINVPTLLLLGQQEMIYDPEKVLKEVLNNIPDSREELIAECGHSIPNDQPELLSEKMIRYLL